MQIQIREKCAACEGTGSIPSYEIKDWTGHWTKAVEDAENDTTKALILMRERGHALSPPMGHDTKCQPCQGSGTITEWKDFHLLMEDYTTPPTPPVKDKKPNVQIKHRNTDYFGSIVPKTDIARILLLFVEKEGIVNTVELGDRLDIASSTAANIINSRARVSMVMAKRIARRANEAGIQINIGAKKLREAHNSMADSLTKNVAGDVDG